MWFTFAFLLSDEKLRAVCFAKVLVDLSRIMVIKQIEIWEQALKMKEIRILEVRNIEFLTNEVIK